MHKFHKSLVWFRRDLRCFDHAALYHALKQSEAVFCVFLFDKEILDELPRADRRVEFIHASVAELDAELRRLGGGLMVRHAAASSAIPALADLGFKKTNLSELNLPTGMSGAQMLLDDFTTRIGTYHATRDFPATKGPSYLSVHLRFGTVSIRAPARRALDAMRTTESSGAAAWLSELIWRDFYFMILHHHPRVAERAFKPEYDAIRWESGDTARTLFEAWRDGRTGYPLVDAAMAQLNRTGYMHNRLRMVTASFLIKDLGIDWRWGERYFAERLNDYDLAANNGGWQWAASSGCDAQPYFRIFNPVTQSEKFDPEGRFIRRYLPRLAKLPDKYIHAPWLAPSLQARQAGVELGIDYPLPIVRHDVARENTLARYAAVKKPL
jgi:deoxyribodipyrimidine photo-lyase